MPDGFKRWNISYRQAGRGQVCFEYVNRARPSISDVAGLILGRDEEAYCAVEKWAGARPDDVAEQFFILNQIEDVRVAPAGMGFLPVGRSGGQR